MALTIPNWPVVTNDDGSLLTGTPFDLAYNEGVEAAVLAQIRDASSGVYAAAIVAEVITARGNLANLNARLSGVIDADGNLINPTDTVSPTELNNALGGVNLIWNSALTWDSANSIPYGWDLVGTGATVATVSSGVFGAGSRSVQVTRSGANVALDFYIVPIDSPAKWANWDRLEGQVITFACLVKASVANQAFLNIFDGTGSSGSSFHTGGGGIELLTVKHTISASADHLRVRLKVNIDGTVDFGAPQAYFGDYTPSDFRLDNMMMAGYDTGLPGSLKGAQFMLPEVPQNFTGLKTFYKRPHSVVGNQGPNSGGSISTMQISGKSQAYAEVAGVGNSAGAETRLRHMTVVGSMLFFSSNNGGPEPVIVVKAAGFFASNANSDKRIRVRLGAFGSITTEALVYDTTNMAHNGKEWDLEVRIYKNGTTTLLSAGRLLVDGSSSLHPRRITQVSSIDWTADNAIAVTGDGTGTSDVVLTEFFLEYK